QARQDEKYAGLAAEHNVYKQIIYAERGVILDANQEVLAHNIPVEKIVADASHLNNREAAIALLHNELGIPPAQLTEKLNSGRRYIVIKRGVSGHAASALRETL